MPHDTLRLGTRGSKLALLQAEEVRSALQRSAGTAVELVVLKTSADAWGRAPAPAVPSVGIFTQELEAALLSLKIDLAVHSLKDLPTESDARLAIAAITRRLPSEDVLISKTGKKLAELPLGAKVGTASPRRRAQLLNLRGDLDIVPIRGNVDSRLRKLRESDLDAIVIARAGLVRMGRESEATEVLSEDRILPPPGQGCLAIQTRRSDAETIEKAKNLDDSVSRKAALAERAFLHALGGGCQIPVGAKARAVRGTLRLDGGLYSLDGRQAIRDQVEGPEDSFETLGRTLADRFLSKGAGALVAEWRQTIEKR